jgi:hypothetical protein
VCVASVKVEFLFRNAWTESNACQAFKGTLSLHSVGTKTSSAFYLDDGQLTVSVLSQLHWRMEGCPYNARLSLRQRQGRKTAKELKRARV